MGLSSFTPLENAAISDVADDAECISAEELRAACSRIPGLNVLDVEPSNINDYCCGAFELVERDVRAVLPQQLAAKVLRLLSELEAPQAMRVREELINYKKLLLHEHQQGQAIERSLAQLTAFFHTDAESRDGGYWEPSQRLAELSDARMQCKGRVEASYDARLVTKLLCCLPRHPAKQRAPALDKLPQSLRTWGIGSSAIGGVESCDMEQRLQECSNGSVQEVERATPLSWHAAAEAAIGSQAWPHHVRHFVAMVVVARGVDKALRIRDELSRVCAAMKQSLAQAETALAQLRLSPSVSQTATQLAAHADGDADVAGREARQQMSRAMRRQKHINLLVGALPPLRESLRWLREIESTASAGTSQLFLAGDGRAGGRVLALAGTPPAACVPNGFVGCKVADAEFRRVLATYKPQMRQVLSDGGWPEHISQRRGATSKAVARQSPSEDGAIGAAQDASTSCAAGEAAAEPGKQDGDSVEASMANSGTSAPADKLCRVCQQQFSALWVHRGICCECEEVTRAAGRCPYGTQCSSSWFCSHDRRCFVCDAHSCEDCRLIRGDGEADLPPKPEAVLELVARLQPKRVALDFDRTLATTRSGACPVLGKHSADPELLSLLALHPQACTIVTRNSHVSEIQSFMAAHGAPPDLQVSTLRRPKSKSEYVLSDLQQEDRIVFVDDSIAELADSVLSCDPRVFRVLFVRALL